MDGGGKRKGTEKFMTSRLLPFLSLFKVAKCYFAQIVHAISYCHRLHVVHRDLKPENVVFFEKQGVVKLTDFGFSNRFQPGKTLNTSCGSLAYSAPEILLGDEYDAPAVGESYMGKMIYCFKLSPECDGLGPQSSHCSQQMGMGRAVLSPTSVSLSDTSK